jgi:hypothetical protein
MKAASEIPYAEQPKPIKTIGIEEFQGAVATLQQTDPKIPSEITRKAIHLISSTNLLPVFDLERSFIIDLPSTNMLALILPLPEISRFSMPPPFKDAQNHTWHSFTALPSKPLKPSCWKERSDQPTGHSTKTSADVICPLLELFILAEKAPKAIPLQIGRQKN